MSENAGGQDWGSVIEHLGHLTDEPTRRDWRAQPDLRDGSVYRCPPGLVTALRVALVTGRPLLLYGWPGSGKSSVAAYVARNLGWRYYEHVVSARMEAQDLLWRFDLVRRLADAQLRLPSGLRDDEYVEPGVLWWALNPGSARCRGSDDLPEARWATDPYDEVNRTRQAAGAVVLIDELDKADPDVPSGLLVPLGSMRFRVADTGRDVAPAGGQDGVSMRRLVIVTTNEERDLPAPFVRRCVTHRLELPTAVELEEIAERHLRAEGRAVTEVQRDRIALLCRRVVELRPANPDPGEHLPSTAELLDAVRVALELGDRLGPQDWELIERLTLTKAADDRP